MAINDSGGATYGGATGLGTVDAILKEVYEARVRDQLNNEVVSLRRIERTSEGVTSQVGGKYVVFPVHVSRNSGIGARLEDEDLPTPGAQGYRRAQVPLRYQYGRLRLTGQTIELAKDNFQAFASAMDQEVTRLKDDLAKDLNRQVYGDGSGVIGTSTGAATGQVVPVDNVMYFQEGMVVSFGADGDNLSTDGVIDDVDVAAGTVTFATGSVPASGDIIVRKGSGASADGSTQREWTGLGALVGTGELFDLTHSKWRSVIDENGGSGRPISESLLIDVADQVRVNGSYPTVMFMNLGVRRQYFNLLTQQRRYTNTQTFEGGFSGLAFTTDKGDIPMVVDTDAPKNTVYGLNEKEIKVYRDADWSFMDRDGSRWARVPNRDAYEATMYQYSELGTHRRNAHFRLEDITE